MWLNFCTPDIQPKKMVKFPFNFKIDGSTSLTMNFLLSDAKLGAKFVSFDELLKDSDFVVVCCPLNSETKEMFNDAAFRKMKPTSIFVNVARGGKAFFFYF